MKSVVVLAPHPQFAEEVRAVGEPLGIRVVHRLSLEDAEPLLAHGLAPVCILDLEFSGVRAVWLVERILRRSPTCEILAFSSVRDPEWEEQLYLAGVRHVFAKPLRPKLLAQALQGAGQGPPRSAAPDPGEPPVSPPQAILPKAEVDPGHSTNQRLAVLHRFSEILTHSLDAAALARESLSLLREILGVNRAAIFLREPAPEGEAESPRGRAGSMRVVSAFGIPSVLTQGFSLSTESGIGAQLLQTGRILRRTDEGIVSPAARHELETMGVDVALPISEKGEMIGVALFDRRVTGLPLTDGEVEGIFHLLEQVARAIGNIERHEHVVGANRLLGEVLRELNNACVVVGTDLAILHANKAARRVMGGSGRRSGTMHFGDLPEELGGKIYQVVQTGAALPSFRYVADTAHRSVYSVSIVPLQSTELSGPSGGNIALMVMEDRTQTEQLQQLEVEAANLRLVNNMADRLAAEIGNAIVPLSVHHQLFEQRFKEAEFRKSLKTALGDSVKRVDRLASQMRFIYGDSNKEAEVIALGDLLDEADKEAKTYFTAKSAKLDCEPDVRSATVAGTRGALRHTFSEIILNGYQANAADARVQVRLTDSGRSNGGDEVGVEFEDAGEGFTDESALQAAEPFFTKRTVGVGLGLSAVRKILEDHGGRLEIPHPKEGGHGVVRVFLPAKLTQE